MEDIYHSLKMDDSNKIGSRNDNHQLVSASVDSIQEKGLEINEWVDYGINNVKVQDLKISEGVESKEDFSKISWEDAIHATEQLPNLIEEVESRKGMEDFREIDRQNGVDPWFGKEKSFNLYYGGDPVKVEKIGDRYLIDHGRHRIFAAKGLGIEIIPARVKELKGY